MKEKRRCILVVEDERVVAKELQQTLRQLGYDVPETADSATEALRLSALRCPDLVLMDIHLRGEDDGVQAAGILRERFDLPVVYLTAFSDEATMGRAKLTEPLGYLVKPVKDADLRSVVELALYRKEMERKLRERERWFSTTLGSIADAVVAADAAGSVTFMNLAAENLTGVRQEHALGLPATHVLSLVDDRTRGPLENALERALAERKPGEVRRVGTLLSAKGERAVEDSAAPIIDERGRVLGAVLVLRDISEQRRLQQQAALADRLASLGTLASGVAHEINNPLAVVVADAAHLAEALELVERELKEAGAGEVLSRTQATLREGRTVLSELTEAAERVRRIVSDLRAFSSPQEQAARAVQLPSVLGWSARMTAHQIRPRARLRMDLGATPPVEASEVRLGQVFVNLLVNAAQAIEEGRPEQNEIEVSTGTDPEGRARVRVRDSGRGIPPEHLPRIFDPFFTTKDVGEGSGLGLAICHGIVKAAGGSIDVESQVGRGTTFTVTLPPAHQSSPPLHGRRSEPGGAQPGRILVVDDEVLLLKVVKRTLEREHEVVTTSSAREALALLGAGPPFDLVLCDLMMPDVTGMNLYERTLAHDAEQARRFVFLSGGAFTARAQEFLAALQHEPITKPFTPDLLRARVQALLRDLGRRRARAP